MEIKKLYKRYLFKMYVYYLIMLNFLKNIFSYSIKQ